MDRQAFWILQEIPELDHQDPKYKNKVVVLEEHRSEACFKTGLIGFHITLFYQYLNKILIEQNYSNDPAKLIEQLDSNWGCLNENEEELFQQHCKVIQEVKSFDKYYTMLGQPVVGDEEVRARLKQAIENSRKKDYHGNSEEVNKVPPVNEQSASFLTETHDLFEFYDEGKKEWIDPKSPKWKEAVMKRYQWISSTLQNFEEQ